MKEERLYDPDLGRNLVYSGYERTDVDFKRDVPWDDAHKFELIKDIAAFANRGGGFLVIGLDESAKTREERRQGVVADTIATWETTRVCRDVNNYISPAIDVDVILWSDESDGNKSYVIVSIPSHAESPHLCVRGKTRKDDRGKNIEILRPAALYFRNVNKECTEIRDVGEYQKLIRRCVIFDREQMLKEFQEVLSGNERTRAFTAKLQARDLKEMMDEERNRIIHLESELPPWAVTTEVLAAPRIAQRDFAPQEVETSLKESSYDYRGWPFVFWLPESDSPPQRGDERIFAFDSHTFNNRKRYNYWALTFGGTFYSRNLTTESILGYRDAFNPNWQIQIMSEVLKALGRIYDRLGISLDEFVDVCFRIQPVKGMQVKSVGQDYSGRDLIGYHHSMPFADEVLTLSKSFTVNSLLNQTGEATADLIIGFLDKFGCLGFMQRDAMVTKADDFLSKGRKI